VCSGGPGLTLSADADVEGNPGWTRTVSSRLYGGDQEHRLRQEKILGIGGVRALRAMGINPVYWHGNEGHAGFHLLERVREWVGEGLTFDEATERVIASSVFTSHTPFPRATMCSRHTSSIATSAISGLSLA
jgi:starch phosphorylase